MAKENGNPKSRGKTLYDYFKIQGGLTAPAGLNVTIDRASPVTDAFFYGVNSNTKAGSSMPLAVGIPYFLTTGYCSKPDDYEDCTINPSWQNALQVYLTALNSSSGRALTYSGATLSTYIMAVATIKAQIAHIVKAYRVASHVNFYNSAMPNYLLRAMNIDSASFKAQRADIREALVGLINFVYSALPTLGDYAEFHEVMMSGVFLDEDNPKSIPYTFVPSLMPTVYSTNAIDIEPEFWMDTKDADDILNHIGTLQRYAEYVAYQGENKTLRSDILRIASNSDTLHRGREYLTILSSINPSFSFCYDQKVNDMVMNSTTGAIELVANAGEASHDYETATPRYACHSYADGFVVVMDDNDVGENPGDTIIKTINQVLEQTNVVEVPKGVQSYNEQAAITLGSIKWRLMYSARKLTAYPLNVGIFQLGQPFYIRNRIAGANEGAYVTTEDMVQFIYDRPGSGITGEYIRSLIDDFLLISNFQAAPKNFVALLSVDEDGNPVDDDCRCEILSDLEMYAKPSDTTIDAFHRLQMYAIMKPDMYEAVNKSIQDLYDITRTPKKNKEDGNKQKRNK